MSVKNLRKAILESSFLLCVGAGSIAFFAFASLAHAASSVMRSQFYWMTYNTAVFGALLVYQPHFIATYRLNYARGLDFIKRYPFTFLIFPLLLLGLTVKLCLDHPTQLSPKQDLLFKLLLATTLLLGIYHFSFQAVGVLLRLSKVKFNLWFKSSLKALFFFTGMYGLALNISANHGRYDLFQISLENLVMSGDSLDKARILLLTAHGILSIYAIKHKIGLRATVPWIAVLVWYTTRIFTVDFFFLIPIFHALQFMPFYFQNIPMRRLGTHASVIALSLLVVFALPNLLSASSPYLFAAVLLSVNLHHFAMERVTFRKAKLLPDLDHFDEAS